MRASTKELNASIEKLYATFARYPLRASMDACPCCVTDEDMGRLCSKELRGLEENDISLYAYKAMTTWGDVEDFKHFLPRIFELASASGFVANRIGNEYSIRGTQVTPATDSPTLSVYFSAENPADGQYLPHSDYSIYVTPEGQATISFSKGTFHYYPAPENTAKINLTTVNGKRKITFQNLQIFASTYGSGRLPNGTKITGVIVEP